MPETTQLELFDAAGAPVASPDPKIVRNGVQKASRTPKADERAGTALAPTGVPIPARCPVTGGRTCHRDGCRHYQPEEGGLCAHPEAPAAGHRPRRRSRRAAR